MLKGSNSYIDPFNILKLIIFLVKCGKNVNLLNRTDYSTVILQYYAEIAFLDTVLQTTSND